MDESQPLIPSDTQIQPNSSQTTATTLTAVRQTVGWSPMSTQSKEAPHYYVSQYFNICPLLTAITT